MSPIYVPGKVVLAKEFTWNETVWNPSMISTALWLDAADATTLFTTDSGSTLATNGSAVGRWNDKSGNSRNFIQATSGVRPTYTTAAQNSRNVVTVGLGQLLTYSNGGLLSNVSGGYIVVAGACTATSANEKIFIQTVGTNGLTTRIVLAKFTGNQLRAAGRRLDLDAFAAVDGSTNIGTAGLIVSASVNYSTTSLTSFRNGTQEAQSNSFQSSGSTLDGGNAALFNTVIANTNNFTGSMFEVIIGHSTPSTDTRQRIEGYLAHKWGLTANLPSDHPYKVTPPAP